MRIFFDDKKELTINDQKKEHCKLIDWTLVCLGYRNKQFLLAHVNAREGGQDLFNKKFTAVILEEGKILKPYISI